VFENRRYSDTFVYKELFKSLYDSNNLITITDVTTYANIFRDLFIHELSCYGGRGRSNYYITRINEFNRLRLSETEWNKNRDGPTYQVMVDYKNELEDLKRKIKVNEKIIFACIRCTQQPSGHAGDQGYGILFVFTNYGKLIRNDFMRTGYLVQDFDTLLHPQAFVIMKKLWELYEREQSQIRYTIGQDNNLNGVIDFFKNIVDISNALRDKDMKLYENKKQIKQLQQDKINCRTDLSVRVLQGKNCSKILAEKDIKIDQFTKELDLEKIKFDECLNNSSYLQQLIDASIVNKQQLTQEMNNLKTTLATQKNNINSLIIKLKVKQKNLLKQHKLYKK
jgi:hypothetical protein